MRVLWKYLRPHQALAVLSLLFAGIAQVLTLLDPVIFGKIIDRFSSKTPAATESALQHEVLWLLLVALLVGFAALLARALQEYCTRLYVQRFGLDIFNDGLKQTLRLSYQEFGEQRSGETLSVLQKVRSDTERFVDGFISVIFSSIVGLGFLIWYAVTKDWLLAPAFLVGLFVIGGVTSMLSFRIKSVQRAINRETNALSGVITESLRNIELVKSLGLTYPEIRRLKEQTQKIYSLEMQKAKKVRTLTFMQGATLAILKQSILFGLLWLIFRHVLSTGELISMQFISVALFGPLRDLGRIILMYREAEASLNNFDELMKKPIEQRPPSPIEIGPVQRLRFDNVTFTHQRAKQPSLDGISFDASVGETIAFVGPSGSGKSTLVKLLVGLYVPESGEISYNDISTKDIRFNELRRQLGFVTQETNLFAGTIKDNMLYVKPDATDAEILDALMRASCKNLLERSPKGIDTQIGEGGMKMSGGEKQRLSIARALIRKPRLLIFDEATSALDSITEEEITDTVRQVSERKEQVTILIAHRLSTIMHADSIYVLEKGKIVEIGSHQELVDGKGLYYAMWRQQIGERKWENPASNVDADSAPNSNIGQFIEE